MEISDIKVPWLEKIFGNIGERSHARTIFGDPVERYGVTVIPVGKLRFGGGGGMKVESEKDEQENSTGGGGGLAVSPVGFIEIRNGKAKFKRTLDGLGIAQVLIGACLGLWVMFRGIGALPAIRGERAAQPSA